MTSSAASPNISWAEMAELAAVGLLSTGGSAALNQYWERDMDAGMGRTSSRPLPSGRLRPGAALLGLSAFRERSGRAFWRVLKISSSLLTFFLVALLV